MKLKSFVKSRIRKVSTSNTPLVFISGTQTLIQQHLCRLKMSHFQFKKYEKQVQEKLLVEKRVVIELRGSKLNIL